ncbi:MAG: glycosyltransferase, partial [Bacteroidaceae bacterium]
IDSILAQTFTDFELLIVDDGSTDSSCKIIESYSDERIRLIKNKHDFINTQNTLLREATGKYIARIDNDDRMLCNRLKVQVDYMENHPEVDVLGTGVQYFGIIEGQYLPQTLYKAITMQEMLKGNVIYNPSVMIRRHTIEMHSLRCEERYKYADDYGLWMNMLSLGLHIENIPDILTEYRTSKTQTSVKFSQLQIKAAQAVEEDSRIFISRLERDAAKKSAPIVDTEKKLTLIIPFLNEGVEVARTVASAREFAKDEVDIIVINDRSDDEYHYYEELKPYNVFYLFNEKRLGVAASRDLGVRLCKTPYFLLLDAHMRFYDNRWLSCIVSLLEKDDRCLLCSQTKILYRDEEGNVQELPEGEEATTYGAYMPFLKENYLPDIEWNYIERYPEEDTEPIMFVLGAGYAGSKRYWTYLKGLQGLKDFGSDEILISLKVWLEGGPCILLKNHKIGHIYRKEAPYLILQAKTIYNNLYIADLLLPTTLNNWAHAVACTKNKELYKCVCTTLQSNKEENSNMKQYLQSIFTVSFDRILEMQQKLQNGRIKFTQEAKDFISETKEWLPTNLPTDFGISEGKAGIIIWLFHYSLYARERVNKIVYTLLEEIEEAVKRKKLPWNFKYGLCGIGWLCMYLFTNKFLRHTNIDILQAVDNEIQSLKSERITNYTIDLGAGGILCYLSTRLITAKKFGLDCNFTKDFLEEMETMAYRTIEDAMDVNACFHAFQYISLRKKNCNTFDYNDPKITEWLEFPKYISKESIFWKSGLSNGCTGYTLPFIVLNKTIIQ